MDKHYNTFQYSFFPEGRDGAQVVVRGDDFAQFKADVKQAKEEFSSNNHTTPVISVPIKAPTMGDRNVAQQDHYCHVHKRDLKYREQRDGNVWDHRLLIDGVWNVCYGQKWIPQNTYKKEAIPEVDINEQ